jgi:hypothetical protein
MALLWKCVARNSRELNDRPTTKGSGGPKAPGTGRSLAGGLGADPNMH